MRCCQMAGFYAAKLKITLKIFSLGLLNDYTRDVGDSPFLFLHILFLFEDSSKYEAASQAKFIFLRFW